MQPWHRYKPDEVVYSGHRKVLIKHFQNDEGRTFDFETFEKIGAESVVVLALDELHQVIVAEQFRVGPEAVMQDLPGGGVHDGQTPEDAAKQELIEETGYASDSWEYLGAAHEEPYNNRTRHYFLAVNAKKVAEPQFEALEDIRVKLISIEELVKNAKTGAMTDALIVLYAYDRLIEYLKD